MIDPTLRLPLDQAVAFVGDELDTLSKDQARTVLANCAVVAREMIDDRAHLLALNAMLASRLAELSRPPWWRRVLGLRGRHG
jgi:hypothetical protein